MLERKTHGSIVCPNCGRLISVTAKKCMHCGRKNPGLWGYGPALQKILGESNMVAIITIVSIALYVLSLLLDPAAILRPQGMFGLLAPSHNALIKLGMTGAMPMHYGRWWTLVTAIYLHGGILHIVFNMLWLRNLGQMVIPLFGTSRAFIIFTVAGIAGFFISDLVGIGFTIGASGSIFGLLGALVYYGRKRGGVFGSAIYRQVGTWTIILLVFGFLMPGINNLAHMGGFAGGFLSAMLLGFHESRPENQNHRILAVVAVAVTIICFALAFYVWIFG
ncbi:rhomboid family intramembrane serine protease [candidate division KSB1 bacterium]|nr:MAG: rhomboid family intramembrane serine protease [candidate division KSB1 bacterium]